MFTSILLIAYHARVGFLWLIVYFYILVFVLMQKRAILVSFVFWFWFLGYLSFRLVSVLSGSQSTKETIREQNSN